MKDILLKKGWSIIVLLLLITSIMPITLSMSNKEAYLKPTQMTE